MTERMEVKSVGLGLSEISGPKFNTVLVVRQAAAKRIAYAYGMDVVIWVQDRLKTRYGMSEIIYELQLNRGDHNTPAEFSLDDIWDNWFDDPSVIGDQSVVANMLQAFTAAMASKDQYEQLQAEFEDTQKKLQKAEA